MDRAGNPPRCILKENLECTPYGHILYQANWLHITFFAAFVALRALRLLISSGLDLDNKGFGTVEALSSFLLV